MITNSRKQIYTLIAALCGLILASSPAASAGADLDDYVKQHDGVYSWKQTSNHTTPAGTIHTLDLNSQQWQGIKWSHELTIYEPAELAFKDTVLLLITGGGIGHKSADGDHEQAFSLTKVTGARVAVLYQVPNQPLLGDKTEDALIAETFVRYLETRDKNWPLLLPMVKSAVRAMDTVQAWAREKERGEIKQFVVTGASKRGWTTWLTGAVDNRVVAIAPMVIVMLNMGMQGPNQLDVWGRYSEQIDDYVNRGLMERVQTPVGESLWKMVDPFTYRDRLSIPKLLINGSNDRYWTLNAIDLYWDGLKGPKYLVELPNAGHGLEVNRDWAINALGAFFRRTVSNRPLPALSWALDRAHFDNAAVTIHANPAPTSARLWSTSSKTRDFRESKWTSSPLKVGTTITASIAIPATGYVAAFGDLEYSTDSIPYHLTTTFFEPGVPLKEPTTSKP
jgi:PhoPQ-activated pathogenicity-related protein